MLPWPLPTLPSATASGRTCHQQLSRSRSRSRNQSLRHHSRRWGTLLWVTLLWVTLLWGTLLWVTLLWGTLQPPLYDSMSPLHRMERTKAIERRVALALFRHQRSKLGPCMWGTAS